MDRHFAARRDQLLADAKVDPRIPRGVLPRLGRFLEPFLPLVQRSEQGGHGRLGTSRAEYMSRTASRRLRRIEEARFYRWKALNRLPPLRVGQLE